MKVDYEWKLEYTDHTENIAESDFEDEGNLEILKSIREWRAKDEDITKIELCLVRHTRHNLEDHWEDHDEAYIVNGKIQNDIFKVPKRLVREFEKNQYWISEMTGE